MGLAGERERAWWRKWTGRGLHDESGKLLPGLTALVDDLVLLAERDGGEHEGDHACLAV